MNFEVIVTQHFDKTYLKKKIITQEEVIQKAREIEEGIFYAGEGRVKGSKVLFKKRIQFKGTSKRRGGGILFVLFHRMKNFYIPYAVWTVSESKKQRIDQQLKSKKKIEKIIRDTIVLMNQYL